MSEEWDDTEYSEESESSSDDGEYSRSFSSFSETSSELRKYPPKKLESNATVRFRIVAGLLKRRFARSLLNSASFNHVECTYQEIKGFLESEFLVTATGTLKNLSDFLDRVQGAERE